MAAYLLRRFFAFIGYSAVAVAGFISTLAVIDTPERFNTTLTIGGAMLVAYWSVRR